MLISASWRTASACMRGRAPPPPRHPPPRHPRHPPPRRRIFLNNLAVIAAHNAMYPQYTSFTMVRSAGASLEVPAGRVPSHAAATPSHTKRAHTHACALQGATSFADLTQLEYSTRYSNANLCVCVRARAWGGEWVKRSANTVASRRRGGGTPDSADTTRHDMARYDTLPPPTHPRPPPPIAAVC